MLSTLLLISSLELGTKGCADDTVVALNDFQTKIEYLTGNQNIFESLEIRAPMTPTCMLTNAETVVEFDIDKNGNFVNYSVIDSFPHRVMDRNFKKAIYQAKLFQSSYGSSANRVKITFVMFKNKT